MRAHFIPNYFVNRSPGVNNAVLVPRDVARNAPTKGGLKTQQRPISSLLSYLYDASETGVELQWVRRELQLLTGVKLPEKQEN